MDELLICATEKVLSKCDTAYATYITEDAANMIRSFMLNPVESAWENISGIMIKGYRTIWQAVCQRDATFPRTGRRYDLDGRLLRKWERVPEPQLLLEAIKQILEENEHESTAYGTQDGADQRC